MPQDPPDHLIRLTLNPRHLPLLILLVVANLALVVIATAFIVQAMQPAPVVVAPPTGIPESVIATEVALRFPTAPPQLTPTPGPTATPPDNPLNLGGTLFYAFRQAGRTNLWAQPLGQPAPTRLTAGPWDDREPAPSPDGQRLAFASKREGFWNIYILNLTTGEISRVTDGTDFKGHPTWSPDGQWLAFEQYRNTNLDIILKNLTTGQELALTAHPAADYAPAWSPNGRSIVWVSLRSGRPELWIRSLDEPQESASRSLTSAIALAGALVGDSPFLPAHPEFSPDGQRVLFVDEANPLLLMYVLDLNQAEARPQVVGQGLHPHWSPDGSAALSLAPQDDGREFVLAAPLGQTGLAQIALKAEGGQIHSLAWGSSTLPATLPASIAQAAQVADAPLWQEMVFRANSDPAYALMPLVDVRAPDPRLSDQVDDAFAGLRRAAAQAVGWDFLGTLDNALIPVNQPLPPSIDPETWLKAGRAFDFAQASAQAGWVEITREDRGYRTFWRVWVRARLQDGSLGEPLRTPPWNVSARFSGRPIPYDAGGEYFATTPPGYFVDFTTLAADFGWVRVPALENWRAFYPGLLFWRFVKTDGLTWLAAMREVYTADQAATRTPVPSPTATPTITQTPTETLTPSTTPTATRTNTNTPRPTRTPTFTLTPRPTRTLTAPPPTRTPPPIIITIVVTITPVQSPTPSPTATETEVIP